MALGKISPLWLYRCRVVNHSEALRLQPRKFQTGGPDGDLGSNEILISKDMTVGSWALVLNSVLSSRIVGIELIRVNSMQELTKTPRNRRWFGGPLRPQRHLQGRVDAPGTAACAHQGVQPVLPRERCFLGHRRRDLLFARIARNVLFSYAHQEYGRQIG